jgi:hypothetical protein
MSCCNIPLPELPDFECGNTFESRYNLAFDIIFNLDPSIQDILRRKGMYIIDEHQINKRITIQTHPEWRKPRMILDHSKLVCELENEYQYPDGIFVDFYWPKKEDEILVIKRRDSENVSRTIEA